MWVLVVFDEVVVCVEFQCFVVGGVDFDFQCVFQGCCVFYQLLVDFVFVGCWSDEKVVDEGIEQVDEVQWCIVVQCQLGF